jgi:hypothetical protein
MHTKWLHTATGRHLLTAAALGFGTVGFLTGANGAVATSAGETSCSPAPSNATATVQAGAQGGQSSAAGQNLDASLRTQSGASAGTSSGGSTSAAAGASSQGTVSSLLRQVKQLSSTATPQVTAELQSLLSQALLTVNGQATGAGASFTGDATPASVRSLVRQVKQLSSGASPDASASLQRLLSQGVMNLTAKGSTSGTDSNGSVSVTGPSANGGVNVSANGHPANPASVATPTFGLPAGADLSGLLSNLGGLNMSAQANG